MNKYMEKDYVSRRLEFEGVVDVGLVVIAHFENPAWTFARDFLREYHEYVAKRIKT